MFHLLPESVLLCDRAIYTFFSFAIHSSQTYINRVANEHRVEKGKEIEFSLIQALGGWS
jgi:hypothetical protein